MQILKLLLAEVFDFFQRSNDHRKGQDNEAIVVITNACLIAGMSRKHKAELRYGAAHVLTGVAQPDG